MATRKPTERVTDVVMGVDPLADDDEVLMRTLYGPGDAVQGESAEPAPARGDRVAAPAPPQPRLERPARTATARATHAPARRRTASPQDANHYKVLSISLYNDDIEKMDSLVKELKKRGFTRANRSALIRFALDQVDIAKMPKGY